MQLGHTLNHACRFFRDNHDVLGVARSATKGEIRSAYRKLAQELHPDKHPESEKKLFEQKFIAIVKAYEVLSDEVMRRKYDASSQQSAETFDVNVDDFGARAAIKAMGEDTPTNWFLMGLVFIDPSYGQVRRYFNHIERNKQNGLPEGGHSGGSGHRSGSAEAEKQAVSAEQRQGNSHGKREGNCVGDTKSRTS